MEYRLDTLTVYLMAEKFSDKIWFVVDKWDYFQKDTIGKQLVRAADSVSANIAEGYGRFFYAESKQFYYYSIGSITETQSWLRKARNRSLIEENMQVELMNELETIHAKLNGYISWLRKAKNNSKLTSVPNNRITQ